LVYDEDAKVYLANTKELQDIYLFNIIGIVIHTEVEFLKTDIIK